MYSRKAIIVYSVMAFLYADFGLTAAVVAVIVYGSTATIQPNTGTEQPKSFSNM
jgi:ribose/xylose/arabinose/galactoside ABC-type transport system permease subunit